MIKLSEAAQRHAGIAYLILTLSVLFLTANHIIGRGFHETLPPAGLAFWRWLIGGLILLPFIAPGLHRALPVYRAALPLLLALSALIFTATTLILVSLNYTTAINVALINAVQPTITVLLTWLFAAYQPSVRQIAGIAIALIGVVITITRGDPEVFLGLNFNVGDLIALTAVFAFSGYAILIPRLPAGLSAAQGLFAIIVIGCTLLAPFHVAEHVFVRRMPMTGEAVTAILILAVFVSCLATLLWNVGNHAVGANIASMFINLMPIFGTVMATTFLGEQLRWFHLAGMALVGAGIFLVASLPGRERPP